MDSLTPQIERSPFYIFAPGYSRFSAGIRCLHLLCHWLNRSGERAYIVLTTRKTGAELHPDLLTPVLNQRIVDWHFDQGLRPIAVYPEVISGNPSGAECVVRYVLNFPGLLGGDPSYDPSELVFGFSRQLAESCGVPENVLHMPVIDRDVFHPGQDQSRTQARKGVCYYTGKYRQVHKQPLFGVPPDAIEIERGGPTAQTPSQIAEIFRASEAFYCFENTALATEAVLCGCPAVFMPNAYLEKPIALEELGWDGYAWGDATQEVARAKATVDAGISNYQRTVDRFFVQLERFAAAALARVHAEPYRRKISLDPYDIHGKEIVSLIRQKKRWKAGEKIAVLRSIYF